VYALDVVEPAAKESRDRRRVERDLSCRHAAETRMRTDWQPGEEPRQPSAAKLRAIRRRVETLGEEVVDEETANHLRRMAAAGWPDPDPETFCMTCSWARPIVAYERVGPLLPPLPKPRAPRAPTRASIERRLRQAEREAKRLSEQLAAIDAKASDTK
jgi:hypothetical protein